MQNSENILDKIYKRFCSLFTTFQVFYFSLVSQGVQGNLSFVSFGVFLPVFVSGTT